MNMSGSRRMAIESAHTADTAALSTGSAESPKAELRSGVTSPPLIRTSERAAFNRCRWAWNLSYLQELRPKRSGPALRFGTLVHEALAAYYKIGRKRGPHPSKTFLEVYERDVKEAGEFFVYNEDEGTFEDEKWLDAREMGAELLEMYVEEYGTDKNWEVLATEQPFQVPVRNPRTSRVLFHYAGILDLVMREISTNRVWIWDHKTTAAVDLTALGLNEQFGSYWAFGVQWLREQGIIHPRYFDDLSGLMVNYLRRARRDDRPRNALGQSLNKDGSVSKRQQAPIFHREPTWRTDHDRDEVVRRALNDHREMEMVKRGDLALRKNPSPWNCRGCAWLDVCELHETGHDWEIMLNGTTESWSPYDEHEIRDAEQK